MNLITRSDGKQGTPQSVMTRMHVSDRNNSDISKVNQILLIGLQMEMNCLRGLYS